MRAAYRAQPLIGAYLDHPLSLSRLSDLSYLGSDPSEHPAIGYEGRRDAYIRDHTWPGTVDTDVLTLDGWWLERYEHGVEAVHAFCERERCPHNSSLPAVWPGSEAYLAGLPGETILVRVHCHC
ncbi:hypothetical protein ACIBM4_35870 [Streptomyces sp. NPDC050256]|uniref:hypothetical protein n=1 Tax=Streptomyces sp. NPDC050256 TaxID=3365607 RepID=UPI0037B696A1